MSVRGWLVVSVLLVAFVAGCQSAPKGGGAASARGEGATAGSIDNPVVVYDLRIPPDPLTSEQKEGILKVAREHRPKGRSIWLIWVHSNYAPNGPGGYEVSVYYSPDEQTARVRRGSCLDIGGGLSAIQRVDWPHHYCQVSPPSEPFTEELGTPQGLVLPFPAPVGIADDDLAEIVDCVYSLKKEYGTFSCRMREWRESAERAFERDGIMVPPPELPIILFQPCDSIRHITRHGETVEIGVGSRQGPMSAHWTVVRRIKTESGYKVIGGEWWDE